jgi:hypothetical protein
VLPATPASYRRPGEKTDWRALLRALGIGQQQAECCFDGEWTLLTISGATLTI